MTVRLPTWCPECGSAAPTVRYNRPCENVYHDVVVNVERQILRSALDWNMEYKRINNLCGGDPYWVTWAEEVLGYERTQQRRVATGLRRTYVAWRGYWVEHSRRTGMGRRKTDG